MEYEKLTNLIINYIECELNKENSQKFCEEFMDIFYSIQNILEQNVPPNIYEICDDINLVCDSYEPDEEIRKMDRYCIDEISLRSKVDKLYKKMNTIKSKTVNLNGK